MKLKKSMIIGISAILTFAAIGISSAAWFQISNSQTVSTTGSTAATYFAGGNGTEEDPYIITRPVHMYNLAWLQYNGEFNNNKAPYHFRIGGDGTDYPVITELDMSGYILPPIGTVNQPFIGVFDGNDATITNLQVSNVYGTEEGNIIKKPTKIATSGTLSGVNIVGLFGVVGDYAGAASSYDTSATSIFDLKIKDADIRSQLQSTLIGVAAGYVNGDVLSNVGIINSTLSVPDNSTAYAGLSENVSDYSVVGYEHSNDGKSTLTTSRDVVSLPQTSTEDTTGDTSGQMANWGASIDMKSIFGRCLQKFNEADAATDFIAGVAVGTATKTITIDNTVNPSTQEETDYEYTSVSQYYTGKYKKNYNETSDATKLEGQYFFRERNSYNDRYIHLCGNSPKYDDDNTTVNVTTNTKSNATYQGYTLYADAPAVSYYKIAISVPETSFYVIKATRNGTTYYLTDAGDYAGVTTDSDEAQSLAFTNLGGTGTITNLENNQRLAYYRYNRQNRVWFNNSTNANYVNFTTDTTNKTIYHNNARQYLYFTGNINTSGTAWGLTNSPTATGIATYEQVTIPATTYYLQASDGDITATDNFDDYGTDWVFSNYSTSAGTTTTIKSVATGTYLYPSTTTVSLSDNSRPWTFDGSGHIYYKANNTNYFLGITNFTILMATSPGSMAVVSLGASYPARTIYMGMDEDFNIIPVNDENDAILWNFSSPTGTSTTISTRIDNEPYYLYLGTDSISLSQTSQTIYRQNNHYAYRYTGGWSDTYYYISCINGVFTMVEGSYTDAINRSTTTKTVSYIETTSTPTQKTNQNLENELNGYYETYMPLSVQGTTTVNTTSSNSTATTTSFAPTDTNTGYLISGGSVGVDRANGKYDTTDSGQGYGGDIRVAWYSMSDIGTATNKISSYTTNNRSQVEVITRTQSSNGWVRISDDFNKNNTSISSTLSSSVRTKTSYNDLGLQKYYSSRNQLDATFLEAPTYIYGLHFMEAEISMNNLAVAERVHIDEHDYSNYQLPRDSIDFNLREPGYINFFAGTYYSKNNSFFSLHKIERESVNNNITAIHQISKIYGKNNDAENGYYYAYDDNNDGTIDGYCGPNGETTLASGYTQVFDCAWIMQRSDLVMNALYYFEIPANPGEYALGSCPSASSSNAANGAYLMYLDIGASAAKVNRTVVLQTITTNSDSYEYPRGVAIIASAAEDVIDYASAAYALSAGYSGKFRMSKTGSTIISDADTDQEYEATFKGNGITLEDADTGNAPSITPKSTSSQIIHRATFIDYNRSAKEYAMTVIDDYMNAAGTAIDHREIKRRVTTTTNGVRSWGAWTELDEGNFGDLAVGKYTMPYIDNPKTGIEYSYYAADGIVLTISWGLDYVQDKSLTTGDYQTITGLTVDIAGKTTVVDPNDIVVTMVDGQTTYTITVNGTTITVTIDGDNKTFTPPTISITPTVVPPNNP